jgi:GT2 family glycosyltransferase
MDVSVVIVSYRVKYFLEQTLLSVEEALQGISSEIMVIDNDSPDDSLAFLQERFHDVKFIANKDNVGFARANNQGIMQAQGTFTLILNPDTIITRDCITTAIEWMNEHQQCGAIGIRMFDGNGNFLPESKRAFPTPWVSFCKIFGLSSMFPNSRVFSRYHLRYLSDRKPQQVDILSGAFIFARTSVLKEIKGFDESFFMYGEDIDLSYRIVKAGYQNWFLPVEMLHYKGESTKKNSMRYVHAFYDAMLIFYRKHFPHYSAIAYPIIKLGVIVRASIAVVKQVVTAPFKGKRNKKPSQTAWVILSDNPSAVALKAEISGYSTAIPASGQATAIIDDGTYSYSQIVEIIAKNTRPKLNFSIYSSRNGIIISPKMQ